MAAFSLTPSFFAQTKTKKPARKPLTKKAQTVAVQPAKTADPSQPTETAETKAPVKKNERPETQTNSPEDSAAPQKKNQSQKTKAGNGTVSEESRNVFSYEFTQPNFVVKHLSIEHDENGKGKITFEKKNFDEPVTDPIQLSTATLERIKNLFQALNFIDSTEDYQSTIRQYAHLGTMKIRQKKDGKERTAEYNWSENKDARALADEYRKIGQQFVWLFDISVSRENQPLQAPGLMDELDSLVRRNELSDPLQIVPFLKQLSDDERIPLIARNHATRLVKEIEKNANGK